MLANGLGESGRIAARAFAFSVNFQSRFFLSLVSAFAHQSLNKGIVVSAVNGIHAIIDVRGNYRIKCASLRVAPPGR